MSCLQRLNIVPQHLASTEELVKKQLMVTAAFVEVDFEGKIVKVDISRMFNFT